MKERALVLVVYERETVDTSAEVVEETVRHIPIRKRPTVHKPLPEAFCELARWVAR